MAFTTDSAKLVYGLFGRVIPSAPGTNSSERQTIGVRSTEVDVTNGDMPVAFKVTSTGAGNVATWTMETGVVAQTTGTPTIVDGDGNDYEGNDNALTTSSKILGFLLQAGASNTGTVAIDGADYGEVIKHTMKPGGVALIYMPSAAALGSGSVLAATFSASGDTLTATFIGDIA